MMLYLFFIKLTQVNLIWLLLLSNISTVTFTVVSLPILNIYSALQSLSPLPKVIALAHSHSLNVILMLLSETAVTSCVYVAFLHCSGIPNLPILILIVIVTVVLFSTLLYRCDIHIMSLYMFYCSFVSNFNFKFSKNRIVMFCISRKTQSKACHQP